MKKPLLGAFSFPCAERHDEISFGIVDDMPHKTHLPSLEQLRAMRKPVQNVNVAHREQLSSLEKMALAVTQKIGSTGFFLAVLAWTIFWLGWNTLAPASYRFDPFPAFVLWLFISNVIQIMLLPLLMVGQNLQGRHAETRVEADFDVNMKAEREIEAILQHLEYQNDLILKIVKHLEGRVSK